MTFKWCRSWLLALSLIVVGAAHAGEATALAEDPVVEQRLIVISEDLRCLVCQNESLAGSRADLAMDLRREIRTQIKAGKTDAEIMDFMVSRYGDFVLYRPPVKPMTWMLWFGPFVLLLGALWALLRMVRLRHNEPPAPALNAAQREKAQALLQDTEPRP
jgi:cytochrome c-type biogenesis protein CcmH